MKYLNKNFKDCPLNQKIQGWYKNKQRINNSKIDDSFKRMLMRQCDLEIDRCWRLYERVPGFEVVISRKYEGE